MITYDSPEKRFADQLLKNAEIRCLQQAIAELQGRLDRLEAASSANLQTSAPKRKCGRPRISDEVKAARKAEKERRKAEVLNSPEVAKMTDTIWKLSGKTRQTHQDGPQTL